MRKRKLLVALVLIGLIAVAAGCLGIRYWWYRGYSRGTRTGVIRKLSVKGSPLCRYFSGEMALIGTQAAGQPQIWEFSVDDDRDANPIVQKLHAAERTGKDVTVEYRQDLGNKGKLWNCSPTEYYVTSVQ